MACLVPPQGPALVRRVLPPRASGAQAPLGAGGHGYTRGSTQGPMAGQPSRSTEGAGTDGTAPPIVGAKSASNANSNSNSSSKSDTDRDHSNSSSPNAPVPAAALVQGLYISASGANSRCTQGRPGGPRSGMPGSSMFAYSEPGKGAAALAGAPPQVVGSSQGDTGSGPRSASASASASARASGSGRGSAPPPQVSGTPQASPWGFLGGWPQGGSNGSWTGQPMPGAPSLPPGPRRMYQRRRGAGANPTPATAVTAATAATAAIVATAATAAMAATAAVGVVEVVGARKRMGERWGWRERGQAGASLGGEWLR